jgi:predicted GH43/DUF377 family glycosyl hydrolase
VWKRLGMVYCAGGDQPWRKSHAYVPTPFRLSDEIIRIYAAFLDESQVGRVGYVDVRADNPLQVIAVSEHPVLEIGQPGAFDDHGVTPMTVVRSGSELLLYYTGWQLSDRVRYFLLTGLARSRDGGLTFARTSRVPILERSDAELTVRTAAHVMFHRGRWRMWYIAGSDTIMVNGKQVPTYDMRYLESADGLAWGAEGKVVMAPEGSDEYGFGRPYVVEAENGFEMWYSVRTRSRGYHLGYARSDDGLQWVRLDHLVGLQPTESDWDSQMQAFGAVVDCKHGRYLFYNGNDFGRTGFGVARWRDR